MDEKTLLDAIAAATPGDDNPLLVYADWLLDRGDARGELIVVQQKIAKEPTGSSQRSELRQRERAIVEANQASWMGRSHDPRITWRFARGRTVAFAHAGVFATEPKRTGADRFGPAPGAVTVYRSYLRFWSNGDVFAVSAIESPSEAVATYLSDGSTVISSGSYTLSITDDGSTSVTFSVKSQTGSVDYTGTIEQSAQQSAQQSLCLNLESHSRINGHRSNETYLLIDASNADTRDGLWTDD